MNNYDMMHNGSTCILSSLSPTHLEWPHGGFGAAQNSTAMRHIIPNSSGSRPPALAARGLPHIIYTLHGIKPEKQNKNKG